MPLCSVEIPRGATPEHIQEAKGLAGKSLEIAHGQLGVPNPKDIEINVVEGMGMQTKLLISYTVGPNEYPNFPIPSFHPTDEQVTQTGEKVRAEASRSGLGVSLITIDAWANSTFILRDPEAHEPTLPVENLKEIGLSIENPQLRLIVSPEKQQGPSVLPPESEPITEPEPNLKFIEGIGKKLSEIFGLPEDSPIPVHVQPALFADTDFAVIFDCQPIGDYQISEKARTHMAQLIEQELNQNPSTRNGSAEVWVRQGQPNRYDFVGE